MKPTRPLHKIGQSPWLHNGTCVLLGNGSLHRHCSTHALIRRDRQLQETRA